MGKYKLFCGIARHEIYVANDKPVGHPDYDYDVVTNQAVLAVRDYLVDSIKDERGVAMQWKRKDGKIVKLTCTVKDE